MFGIFKSKYNLINSGLMKGMTDIHSHVLPGVDDGSPDINTSLSLLRYMESIGLREVWLTPHIMEDYPTLNKKLQQQFDVLKAAYSGPLNLRLSSEYMMDAAFTNKLDGEVLPLGSSHLLVETSYMYPPPGLPDILMKIWILCVSSQRTCKSSLSVRSDRVPARHTYPAIWRPVSRKPTRKSS